MNAVHNHDQLTGHQPGHGLPWIVQSGTRADGGGDGNGKCLSMIKIDKVEVKYCNIENAFGQVEFAVLQITGLLLKLEMEERYGRARAFAHLNWRGKRLTKFLA
jgi:hypothetical protein